jgi:hypothetical protein
MPSSVRNQSQIQARATNAYRISANANGSASSFIRTRIMDRRYVDLILTMTAILTSVQDTDQSLLILMSFLHNGGKTPGIDHLDFAARLKHWSQFGFRPMDTLAPDIGGTIGAVIKDPIFLDNPFMASTK